MLSAQLPAWVARLVTLGQLWLFVSLQLEVAGPHPLVESKVTRGDGSSEKDRTYSVVETKVYLTRTPDSKVFFQEKHLEHHSQGSPSLAAPF